MLWWPQIAEKGLIYNAGVLTAFFLPCRLWIFALHRYSVFTKEKTYNDIAIQLAKAIIPYFVVKNRDGPAKGESTGNVQMMKNTSLPSLES